MNDHRDRSVDPVGDTERDALSPTDRLVVEAMSQPVSAATEQRMRARLDSLRDRWQSSGAPRSDVSPGSRRARVAALVLSGLVGAGLVWMAWSFTRPPGPLVDAPRPASAPQPVDGDSAAPVKAPAPEHDPAMIPSDDDGYGTLTGQFVVSGTVPVLPPLVSATAPGRGLPAKCGTTIPDESLVIDPNTNGIENVVLYLPKAPPSIHPALIARPLPTLAFDATCGRFVPHVLLVQTHQVVACRSLDPLAYNVHTFPPRNRQSNFIVGPAPAPTLVVPGVAERLPFKVGNDIHTWMSAHWLVLDHPYAAITAKDGRFSIRQLPVGTHTIHAWHERGGYLIKAMTVKINSGEQMDLGTVSVSANRLKG